MPRTKVPRNVVSNKRARDNAAEMEELARDFDIEAENSIEMLKTEHVKAMRELDAKFDDIKRSIPARILSMKMSDVKLLKDFNEVAIEEKMSDLNMTVKETVQRADEEENGRITSGSGSCSGNKSFHKDVSVLGSLQRGPGRRRSKSVSSMALSKMTPGPRTMASATRGRTTPAAQPTGPHASRSKYRTPLKTASRVQAMSVDRGLNMITPKGNPNYPFTVLRHARAGEAIFAVTGSPILASNIVEFTANVNIPIADGIMSIRPQNMDPTNLDQSLVNKIDQHTFNHLRTLKTNLDILMKGFTERFKK